jgi:hypothetical protein
VGNRRQGVRQGDDPDARSGDDPGRFRVRLRVAEASAAVLLGTLFSVVTVTGMLYLLRGHLIPLSLF